MRGRVIAGFGPRVNGQQNDGINIALPEGTPIKAAEDGVVAYAGSELRGYGNLVLIRHSNGYVTAYAHTQELMVKRGDTIKRGQVIAKSGQTGNIDSPQLHFEIRKGPTPVDPVPPVVPASGRGLGVGTASSPLDSVPPGDPVSPGLRSSAGGRKSRASRSAWLRRGSPGYG